MWLINTTTFELHYFIPETAPNYGILSHRWESTEQEMTFQDYRKKRRLDTSGYHKIQRFCALLSTKQIYWAWVDTCCIDKKSSAELSEAINSMYGYYRKSVLCCVYLRDATCDRDDWKESEWWHRGWTLQELLAPSTVHFYDADWQFLSSRTASANEISAKTQLPKSLLSSVYTNERFNVAQKMSWAAERTTTRVEDRAYSLLGLFNIHMPLLYGEGNKAFQRLQLEILRKYPDESIYAWHSGDPEVTGVLAASPDQFRRCSNLKATWTDRYSASETPLYSPSQITSWGVGIRMGIAQLIPRRPLAIKGVLQRHLIATQLTVASPEGLDVLPCTLVLARCGPGPWTYMRYAALHVSDDEFVQAVELDFEIGETQPETLVYLHFDDDTI